MTYALLLQAALGPLLTFGSEGEPVRMGVPVPSSALAEGLSIRGEGVVQWRHLTAASSRAPLTWIEIAVVAPRGTVRVMRGGSGPSPDGRGPAFVRELQQVRLPGGIEHREILRWCDGTIDQRVRSEFTSRAIVAGETYEVGEARTVVSSAWAQRARPWWRQGRAWAEAAGWLPVQRGGGAATRPVRRQLALVVDALVELPGERGAGDFARSGDVVTNLEYDTTLALLRCAVGLGSERAFEMALRAGRHLRDRDLDASTGLPFVHGPDHRSNRPEPGHVWLQGLLAVGLAAADDEAIVAATAIGRALAATLPVGTGHNERLRDFAWPLLELEALLGLRHDPVLARAADRLVASIRLRFDESTRTFRFGEGELGPDLYFERAWLTGGLLLPALRRHLRRRPDAELRRQLAVVEAALLAGIGSGGVGLPTHWRVAGGNIVAVHRERNTVEAAFLLDGLPLPDLLRLLRRSSIRRAITGMPLLDDPDLATQFTLLARSDWPWR